MFQEVSDSFNEIIYIKRDIIFEILKMGKIKTDTGEHKIRVFNDIYSSKEAQEIALNNKDRAFNIIHNVKNIFTSKQIEVGAIEKHYHPFWHISAENYQEYKRISKYSFAVKPEVRAVKINGKSIEISEDPECGFQAEDHCVQHHEKEIIIDATEKNQKNLKDYMKFESKAVKNMSALKGKNKVVISAEKRASFLIRELFKELIRPIQADKIVEERVSVTNLILYFRPTYSIELVQKSTGKSGVLEIDALTGNVKRGKILNTEFVGNYIKEDLLFDVGAELASAIVPGMGVGAVIGKEIKKRYGKKKEKEQMEKSKAAFNKKKSKK